jgi:hypothetical protein
MTSLTTFDTLKGAALVCTFLGFLAMCAALVQWHDKTWKIAIEPTRANVYSAQMRRALDHSACLRSFWMRWPSAGCRLI